MSVLVQQGFQAEGLDLPPRQRTSEVGVPLCRHVPPAPQLHKATHPRESKETASHPNCQYDARPFASPLFSTIRERPLPYRQTAERDKPRPIPSSSPIAQHAASPPQETAHLPRDLPQSRDHTTGASRPGPTDPNGPPPEQQKSPSVVKVLQAGHAMCTRQE